MNWSSVCIFLLLGLSAIGVRAQNERDSASRANLLEQIRSSALQYTNKLPDFICTQTTTRRVTDASGFPSGMTGVSSGGRSVLGMPSGLTPSGNDTIEEHLTFYDRSEHYQVISVNGEKISGLSHLDFTGALSAGEFGSALENIFEPSTDATFSWERNSSIKGRRAYVISFRVPKDHGNLVMYRRNNLQILVPYSGRVFIDADDLQVLRISSDLELPAGFPIKSAQTTVEYRPVEIAGKSFNLPYESDVRLEDGSHLYVNEIRFRKYHKFASDSTIHYDGDTQPQQ